MISAIIGDVVGSRFEWNNLRSDRRGLSRPDGAYDGGDPRGDPQPVLPHGLHPRRHPRQLRLRLHLRGQRPAGTDGILRVHQPGGAIRSGVSIGGDSDTIAAIAGAVAGAYYGVPDELRGKTLAYMDDGMKEILFSFEQRFCTQSI